MHRIQFLHGLPSHLIGWFLLAAVLAARAPANAVCAGDCNGDATVTVHELVSNVRIALGDPLSLCPSGDINDDATVTVDELVTAVANALSGCPAGTPAPTPTATPTEFVATPTPTAADEGDLVPPTGSALPPWLQALRYRSWTAESAVHSSGGPHGGRVRTFFNDIVLQSLAEGNAAHPTGAALVKELYGGGDTLIGWAVEAKVQSDSDGGNGWYWWEGFGPSPAFEGFGIRICTGCHGGNYREFVSKDFVLSPYPVR